jgi:bile acid:Na+ symporter, BASS family
VESSIVTSVLLPGALAIIMFGLGLSLTIDDFRRVAAMPRAVVAGLVIQTVLLTAVCAAIVIALDLPSEFAVGMMLIAASPGGASANIFSHLAHGDVALNITLTAVNSVLALLTLPLIVSVSLWFFVGRDAAIPPPFVKVAEVSLLIITPVALGMAVRAWRPAFAAAAEAPVRVISVLVLALFSAIALFRDSESVVESAAEIALACVLFNVSSMLAGYLLPRWLGLDRAAAIAISMEIGIHNAALAIFVALNVLGEGAYAIPAAIYSVVMVVTAALFTLYLHWQRQRAMSGAEPTAARRNPNVPGGQAIPK